MKAEFVTVEICVFCGWCFSNQFDIMSETSSFHCDTVGRELWSTETDCNIHIGQQGYVFIF